MYYIVRKGEHISLYHEAYESLGNAKMKSEMFKSLFGHEYDIIHMTTVYTTQTLAKAMQEK